MFALSWFNVKLGKHEWVLLACPMSGRSEASAARTCLVKAVTAEVDIGRGELRQFAALRRIGRWNARRSPELKQAWPAGV